MDPGEIDLDSITKEAEILTDDLMKKQNEVTQLLIRAKLLEIEFVFEVTRPDKEISLENIKTARVAAAAVMKGDDTKNLLV